MPAAFPVLIDFMAMAISSFDGVLLFISSSFCCCDPSKTTAG
jgi:hypothetical protein